ncbi:adenine phosphoribosyltransferase [Campylobacter canadensis]|uniref:Adenine phosphoribosyltransferase n=1 Tax=Campylobacter canadensis TaxID=449520 RepID=A0ABS7WRX3_9BACT|nr:adenine phosphoribosyltransferase [Campylobacter canadensis]MBZ7987087.1 adenine phosphoribosyltransferase [Campylobacter canadensis]MBZ7994701.1 adenine phosphoribosyltransferase [Campylobacter canadensis]MBZ7996197.1 adenine phosphoribosyltransferase [Campylobacter canadensis]MBZ7998123.1 adenine phosphoribosyltransferase [Campylobacter canadensis]MBZ7999987.1 adenine phosphoribosyltransferase [Campylobacter canadensis]
MDIKKALNEKIKRYPNFPKEGILFADISTLLADEEGFKLLKNDLKEHYKNHNFDYCVGIESRGFIFASIFASIFDIPLILIRKKGKLPGECYTQEYELEYGFDYLQIKKDVFSNKKANVLFMDDLLATGGTANAAIKLLKQAGANKISAYFLLDINLNGLNKIKNECEEVYCVLKD